MFNQVKVKLTSIYTLSMLCLLLIFITSLYLLISHEINEGQLKEVQSYFNKEKSHFLEEFHEDDDKHLSYEPGQRIFYYVFDKNGVFVYGEESEQALLEKVNSFFPSNKSSAKRVEWKQNHLVLKKHPIIINGSANHQWIR